MTKQCSLCGLEKSLDDFHRLRRSKDGRQPACKSCARERDRLRYADPATGRAVGLDATTRRWREQNRERARAAAQARRQQNPERYAEAVRRWQAANRELIRAHARARYLINREREIARSMRWQQENRERHAAKESLRRARLLGASDDAYPTAVMATVMAALRVQPCVYCGATASIEIDHVVPISRGGLHRPDNLAPACKRCNTSKGNRLLSEWAAAG